MSKQNMSLSEDVTARSPLARSLGARRGIQDSGTTSSTSCDYLTQGADKRRLLTFLWILLQQQRLDLPLCETFSVCGG